MRHLKPDVSHRIRRRPSIFTARWFRLTLAAGLVVVLGLIIWPPMATWLAGTPSARPAPAARITSPAPRAAEAPAAERTPPVAASPASAPAALGATPAPVGPSDGTPSASRSTAPASAAAPEPAARPAAPPRSAIFRIQVGAFLDHRNADRLTARLRGEGVDVLTSVVEESRTTYRVLAIPGEGIGYEPLVERLRQLGYTPELADNAAAVTRPVPLASAVETSRRLREQGIRVRLEQRPSSAAFRVVRVGAYPTAEEAERARAELARRGHEGFVIREH